MSLQFAILGILTYFPMDGYYLKKVFDKSINYIWTANLSQIYRELASLEKKGYVTSSIKPQEDRPDKKVYSITEEGRKAFEEWLVDFPESLISPKRDEFMLRMLFGSKIGKAEMKRQFERFIEQREKDKKTFEELKEYFEQMVRFKGVDEKTIKEMEKDEPYWRFTTKRAQMTNELLIRWAKECIKELEDPTV